MAIERLERQFNRRQFLAGLGLSSISALLAREAILKSQHESSPGVSTGTGASPLDEIGLGSRLAIQQAFTDAFVQKNPTGAGLQTIAGRLNVAYALRSVGDPSIPFDEGWEILSTGLVQYNSKANLGGTTRFHSWKNPVSTDEVDIVDYTDATVGGQGTDSVDFGGSHSQAPNKQIGTLILRYDNIETGTVLDFPTKGTGAQITATAAGAAGAVSGILTTALHRHGVSLAAVANIANVGDGLEAAGTSTTIPRGDHKHQLSFASGAANPTTTQITAGNAMLWKNTTNGELRLWANDGGTLKSVLLA